MKGGGELKKRRVNLINFITGSITVREMVQERIYTYYFNKIKFKKYLEGGSVWGIGIK